MRNVPEGHSIKTATADNQPLISPQCPRQASILGPPGQSIVTNLDAHLGQCSLHLPAVNTLLSKRMDKRIHASTSQST